MSHPGWEDLLRCNLTVVELCTLRPNFDCIVNEDSWFPSTHFITPFIFMLLLGNLGLLLILDQFWESVEWFIVSVAASFVVFVANSEKTPDNMLSDVFLGFLAGFLATYILTILGVKPAVLFFPSWRCFWRILKYFFELIVLAVPTTLLDVKSMGNSEFPVGFAIFGFWVITIYIVFSFWNAHDTIFTKHTYTTEEVVYVKKERVTITTYYWKYTETPRDQNRFFKEQCILVGFLMFYFASMFLMYASPFKMVCVNALVFFLVTTFILIPMKPVIFPEDNAKSRS